MEKKTIITSEEHWEDPVIAAYKRDVDRTLIRENLRLTVDQRLQVLEASLRSALEIRASMRAAKAAKCP